jgi:hypothetical protein
MPSEEATAPENTSVRVIDNPVSGERIIIRGRPGRPGDPLSWAYLFWGAEYWLLRAQGGDPRYVDAFARVLSEA